MTWGLLTGQLQSLLRLLQADFRTLSKLGFSLGLGSFLRLLANLSYSRTIPSTIQTTASRLSKAVSTSGNESQALSTVNQTTPIAATTHFNTLSTFATPRIVSHPL